MRLDRDIVGYVLAEKLDNVKSVCQDGLHVTTFVELTEHLTRRLNDLLDLHLELAQIRAEDKVLSDERAQIVQQSRSAIGHLQDSCPHISTTQYPCNEDHDAYQVCNICGKIL